MSLSRRDCLRAGLVAGAGAAIGGCAPLARRLSAKADFEPLPAGPVDKDARLLNRLTYGPRPGDLAEVRRIGHEAVVKRELAAAEPEDLSLQLQLQRLDALQIDREELRDLPEGAVLGQLQQAALLRAVHGRNQLFERMAEFWSDHFNVYAQKGEATYRIGAEQMGVVRERALGRFSDMLRGCAHDPAVLVYLDNQRNLRSGPNENYARELMELHTLGVDGGYTQRDVREVARCFTGWGVETRFLRHRGAFRFDPDRHDDGEKTVLGVRIPAGGGQTDGERVLDLLARHPATARHLSRKLCRHFLGDDGPKWEARMEKAYLETGGELRAMLEPMLVSPELIESPPILKRPLDFVASTLRAVGGQTDGGRPLQDRLAAMGQPAYQWPMPDGYPEKPSAWTGTMLARWNFALALAQDQIGGTDVPWNDLAARLDPAEAVLSRHPGGADRRLEGWRDHPPMAAALALASPEFQWR